MQRCVYATSGWGIHDDRWCAALREVGFAPTVLSLGRDADSTASLAQQVLGAAGTDLPVLAGPLHSVTSSLVDLPIRLVGLSWGYDLEDMQHAHDDLSWLSRLSRLIVDSATNRDIATRSGLPSDRITFLPWGVDLSVFSHQGPRVTAAALGLPEDALAVLSLRAHEPRYRVIDIIDAFAQTSTPNLALVIGGGGSMTAELEERVARYGIGARTRFIGMVPEAELAPLLRGTAVYVTASEVDGTSVTLLQAMAVGACVVASDSAGNLGWIVDGDTGLTFPVGGVSRLSDAIDRAVGSDTDAMRRSARYLVNDEADWHANLPRLRDAMLARSPA